MAYKPLVYPATLTKTFWDKKKGLIGKAAGETGIGDAAAKAEAAFKKINWNVFDIVRQTPLASNAETLKQAIGLKAAVLSEHGKSVKPTIDGLHILAQTAKGAPVTIVSNPLVQDSAEAPARIVTIVPH